MWPGFQIQGCKLVLPFGSATSTLARRVTLASRWINESQPICKLPVGLWFPHPAGRYQPGKPLFRPEVFESKRYRRRFDPAMRSYPPGVRRDFSVVPRYSSRGVLAPWAPAYQQSLRGRSRFHTLGGGIPERSALTSPVY